MKNTTYSKDIAEAIQYYLCENEWHFSFDGERGIFQFGVGLRGKIKNVCYVVGVKEASYIVLAYAPIGADVSDSKIMSAMTEFICRANYGLENGNFEFDMNDGEIRYKCFVDCDGIFPTSDMIESSIHCPAVMFERYGEGIVGVIFGGLTAKEAVEKCENGSEDILRTVLSDMGVEDDGSGIEGMIKRFEEGCGQTGTTGVSVNAADEPGMPKDIKIQLFVSEGGAQ